MSWLGKATLAIVVGAIAFVNAVEHLSHALGVDEVLLADPLDDPAWREVLDAQRPGDAGTGMPVLLKTPINPDLELWLGAIERMERNNKKAITLLPVVGDGGKVTGILRLHDLVQAGLITQSTSGD